MAHQDQGGSLVENILDRRKRGLDAFIVGDFAAFHRDVEVHPHQDALALQVNIFYGFLIHEFSTFSGFKAIRVPG